MINAILLENNSFESIAKNLPTDIVHSFFMALSTGLWPDGREVTSRQKDICQEVLELRLERCFSEQPLVQPVLAEPELSLGAQ